MAVDDIMQDPVLLTNRITDPTATLLCVAGAAGSEW